MDNICNWKNKNDEIWDSDCGERFVFNCDTPLENGFKYCPYCGKELKEVEK